jgi:hypothetical protein
VARIASLNRMPARRATSPESASRRFSIATRRRSSPSRDRRSKATSVAFSAPALAEQRREIAQSVVPEHNCLAIDQGALGRQSAHCLGDPRESVREVRAAPTPPLHPRALFEAEQAIAVVLHLMQPASSCGRSRDKGRTAGPDEPDWKAPSGRRSGTPNMSFM